MEKKTVDEIMSKCKCESCKLGNKQVLAFQSCDECGIPRLRAFYPREKSKFESQLFYEGYKSAVKEGVSVEHVSYKDFYKCKRELFNFRFCKYREVCFHFSFNTGIVIIGWFFRLQILGK